MSLQINSVVRFVARRLFTVLVVLGLLLPQLVQATVVKAAPADSPVAVDCSGSYQVKTGGNVGGVALQTGWSAAQILAQNPGLTASTRLTAGQIVILPPCGSQRSAPSLDYTRPIPGGTTRQSAVGAGRYYLRPVNNQQAYVQLAIAIPVGAAIVVSAPVSVPSSSAIAAGSIILGTAVVGKVWYENGGGESVSSLLAKCQRLLDERFPHMLEGDYRARQRVENAGRVQEAGNGNGQIPPPSGCWHRPAGTYAGVPRDAATIVEYTVPVFKSGGNKYTTVSILYNVTNMKASTLTHGSTIQNQPGWQLLSMSDRRCGVAHNVAKLIVHALVRAGVP